MQSRELNSEPKDVGEDPKALEAPKARNPKVLHLEPDL